MSSSRATSSLFGRLAATAGAAMRSDNGSGNALRAIVGGESSTSMLLQSRPHATSSWIKLFKPAQAFFGGSGSSSSGSAASTSSVSASAAASVSAPVAAAPPQFGFAASAASAVRNPAKPASSPPRKTAAAAAAASPAAAKPAAPKKPKREKRKQAPRGPTPYVLFVKEQLAAAAPSPRQGGQGGGGAPPSFAERSAAVAAAWRALPASDRARFEAASRAAKLALPPREPRVPTRALSGYQLFVKEKLPTLRDEGGGEAAGGGGGGGGAANVSAMRAVGAAWRSAPAQVKAEYAARAKAMGIKR